MLVTAINQGNCNISASCYILQRRNWGNRCYPSVRKIYCCIYITSLSFCLSSLSKCTTAVFTRFYRFFKYFLFLLKIIPRCDR